MASFSFSILFMSTLLFLLGVVSTQLSSNFYASSCPAALSTIQGAVSTAVSKERRMGASLLRLHFHDCFVNGCDASVLLDDTPSFKGEKTAGPNSESVRGFELGGNRWNVQLGRRDATTASSDAAKSDLPSPFSDLSILISAFANKGFTAQEMVVLSGAHTIGQARCLTFRTRLYEETNLDSAFATSLKQNCPRTGGDNNLSPLDETAGVFDNTYFRNLVDKKGLFHSDQQLFSGGSTDSQVTTYSLNSAKFFADFGSAMIKMGNLSPLTGSKGEIRTNCRKTNGS